MSDSAPRKTEAQLKQRDAETYIAIGIFIAVLGVPVLIGTLSALDRPHAAIVNAICGATLLLMGLGSIGYGWWLYVRRKKSL